MLDSIHFQVSIYTVWHGESDFQVKNKQIRRLEAQKYEKRNQKISKKIALISLLILLKGGNVFFHLLYAEKLIVQLAWSACPDDGKRLGACGERWELRSIDACGSGKGSSGHHGGDPVCGDLTESRSELAESTWSCMSLTPVAICGS